LAGRAGRVAAVVEERRVGGGVPRRGDVLVEPGRLPGHLAEPGAGRLAAGAAPGRAQPGDRLIRLHVVVVAEHGEQVVRVQLGHRRGRAVTAVGIAAGEGGRGGRGRARADPGGVAVPGGVVGELGEVRVHAGVDV